MTLTNWSSNFLWKWFLVSELHKWHLNKLITSSRVKRVNKDSYFYIVILVNYLGTKTQCCLCHHNLIKYGFYGGGFLGIFLTWSLFLSFRTGARSLSIILPLLGITWIFGFLAFNSDTIAFEYIFAIANSLQVPINSALFICCCYYVVALLLYKCLSPISIKLQAFF